MTSRCVDQRHAISLTRIDEEDAFESDFESTDEEVAQEDVDATAEKLVREEERATHKACCLIFFCRVLLI